MRFKIFFIIGLLFIKPILSKELLYSDEYIIDFLSENITKKKEEIMRGERLFTRIKKNWRGRNV